MFSAYSFWWIFFNSCVSNPPSTPFTHWLRIHFAPGQCHRFEYQTPIKATSLGLFEHHHAVTGRWAAQGKGSWNYWVKILMEQSQSLWRCSQRLMLMFSNLHLGNTDICVCLLRKSWLSTVHALFPHRLHTSRVSHIHTREVEDKHSFLQLATEQLQLNRWGLRALLKGIFWE